VVNAVRRVVNAVDRVVNVIRRVVNAIRHATNAVRRAVDVDRNEPTRVRFAEKRRADTFPLAFLPIALGNRLT
jgi:hypothetical protein